jgi:hypothetical protein
LPKSQLHEKRPDLLLEAGSAWAAPALAPHNMAAAIAAIGRKRRLRPPWLFNLLVLIVSLRE